MQLKTKDGICCDYCGTTHKNDFNYYSFDFKSIVFFNNRRPDLNSILRSTTIFSCDICTNCFESFKKIIVNNSKKHTRHKIVCDWTGDTINSDHYYCVISQVKVSLNNQPNICAKCSTQTFDYDKPCTKCNGNDFVKLANIQSDDRYLELNINETAYNHFVDKTKSVIKIAGQWSTTTS